MRAFRTLGKKLRLGRLGVPLWSLALAGAAIVAAAGQAVGPVLSGSVTGSAGLTVEQALVLSSTASEHSVSSLDAADEGLVVVNDEGTSFTAAIELHTGDTVTLNLDLNNVSDAAANGILELNVPAGVDVELDDTGNVDEAQMSKSTWLIRQTSGGAGVLALSISTKDDLKPGFYTISGRIVQITG
ncbi:MAG: hypothetical protein HY681_00235 [Chloroflexi bacterium]|nr:hypothetical protein [Chloroflexota bacterium]